VQNGIIATVVLVVFAMKWRDLLLHALDPQQAQAMGLPVRLLHYGFLSLLSLTIVGALSATGIILTIALLITLGAVAILLTKRFGTMLIVLVLVAVVASFTGVYVSFFVDSAPAPTIVLLMASTFVAAFVRQHGLSNRRSVRAAE
jgi:manganese/iron transport system permease protein